MDAPFLSLVVSGAQDLEDKFSEVERWLHCINRVQWSETISVNYQPVLKRKIDAICAAIVHLSEMPEGASGSFHQQDYFAFSEGSGFYKKLIKGGGRFERLEIPLNNEIKDAASIVKSINRRLSKLCKDICGHRKTKNDHWEDHSRPFQRNTPVIFLGRGDCPCCIVLDQWRAYVGKILFLAKESKKFKGEIYDDGAGTFRGAFIFDCATSAEVFLSSFTWFAVAISNALKNMGNSNDSDSAASETPMIVDLYRDGIQSSGYTFRAADKEYFARYSIAHARKLLAHSIDLMRPDFSSKTKRLLRDEWYLGMAEYFYLRSGTRLRSRPREPKWL